MFGKVDTVNKILSVCVEVFYWKMETWQYIRTNSFLIEIEEKSLG